MKKFLQYDLSFEELYEREGLKKIDLFFLKYLKNIDESLYQDYLIHRSDKGSDENKSVFLVEIGKILDHFIIELFNIQPEDNFLKSNLSDIKKIYDFRRQYIQKHIIKKYDGSILSIDIETIHKDLESHIGIKFSEYDFVKFALSAVNAQNTSHIDLMEKFIAYHVHVSLRPKFLENWIIFNIPKKVDPYNLIDIKRIEQDNYNIVISNEEIEIRGSFEYKPKEFSQKQMISEVNYCIHCHVQEKDSCSRGMKVKEASEEENKNTEIYQKNSHDITLGGCPLDEKISEMNMLKSQYFNIGALAMAMVDNPMLAATGYKICNDCMKSCIYQKQEPVDIPKAETLILEDVLTLPWGFEIYSLLSRWNPLKLHAPLPHASTEKNILIVGMGPAGFTAAHHLLNDGHNIVAIDGLKIEKLDIPFIPIKNIHDYFNSSSERLIGGFGGVMEYGITARWNKNYLLLIRLLLERRARFSLISGVRLGSNLTIDDAFKLGFHHIVLAVGAGKPNLLAIPNILSSGVRMASDFLMTLQLNGAYQKNSVTSLQIRMPIAVIGAGLTAVDTAVESLNYYLTQIQKFASEHKEALERMTSETYQAIYENHLSTQEKIIREEFLAHAAQYAEANTEESRLALINDWGGMSIIYRSNMEKSPAYRLNHEELHAALRQGVRFIENINPTGVLRDEYGDTRALKCDNNIEIEAKTIFIATGTSPNTIISSEEALFLSLEGRNFKQVSMKDPANSFFVYDSHIGSISHIGDAHPKYAGNVVKAMASAKHASVFITKHLSSISKSSVQLHEQFIAKLKHELTATVEQVNRLAPNIIEIIVHAPMCVRHFKPGQFYKLQNFANSEENGQKIPPFEPIAATGASVDIENNRISLILLEVGVSTRLSAKLKVGEEILLMGPTGAPTEIPFDEKIILIGGGLGNAVLFSIANMMKQNNNYITYFAGYRHVHDRVKLEEITASVDKVVWCCDEKMLKTTRAQDESFYGNIIDAIKHHRELLKDADRVIVIGSVGMMSAAKNLLTSAEIKPLLADGVKLIASINSPMQCMMKAICGQCLQTHYDLESKKTSYIFSCSEQDQNMNMVCFDNLQERLRQNSLFEKISNMRYEECR